MDQGRLTQLMAGAFGAGALMVLLCVCRRRQSLSTFCGVESEEEKLAKLKEVLAELSGRFFDQCQDLAGTAKMIRSKLSSSGTEISEEKLVHHLKAQCTVFETLREIQAEVTAKHKCSAEEVELMQGHFLSDPEVREYADGFQTMLTDALQGTPPLLPNFKAPPLLDEERVLKIFSEARNHELQNASEQLAELGGRQVTNDKLFQVLTSANKAGTEAAVTANREFGATSTRVFQGAMSLYLRQPDFVKERQRLEDQHFAHVQLLLRAHTGRLEAKDSSK